LVLVVEQTQTAVTLSFLQLLPLVVVKVGLIEQTQTLMVPPEVLVAVGKVRENLRVQVGQGIPQMLVRPKEITVVMEYFSGPSQVVAREGVAVLVP
jgi:hypothetical protein